MKKLKLVPDNTRIKFVEKRYWCIGLSILCIAASIALYLVKGLNYGIDFQGGIMIEAKTEGPADLKRMRTALGALDLGDVAIQAFGSPDVVLIRMERQEGGEAAQQAAVVAIQASLKQALESDVGYRRVEIVGPKVSGELRQQGFLAIALGVIAIVIYIWVRFEWQFGIGTVLSLVHDVMLTIGFFSITGLEFNLSILAAILTIVGYSMNDTVVVFDRIRENMRKYKRMNFLDLINLSVNETLSRTIMTSVTTLLALLGLFLFGGAVIQGFTAAMIFGVFVGTYSSIYIAAPVLIWLNVRRDEAEAEPLPKKA